MELTREELKKSAEAQKEISETQIIQRKENLIFKLNEILSEDIEKIYKNDPRKIDFNTVLNSIFNGSRHEVERRKSINLIFNNSEILSSINIFNVLFDLINDQSDNVDFYLRSTIYSIPDFFKVIICIYALDTNDLKLIRNIKNGYVFQSNNLFQKVSLIDQSNHLKMLIEKFKTELAIVINS